MRCLRVLGLAAIMVALGLACASGSAQEANPPGSYQQTCSNISVKKGNLYAKCADEKGKTHSARLSSYESCSDIVNKNGSLECARGERHEGHGSSQPPGSYMESCRDIQMKGSTLHAICRSFDGREAPTSLHDANRCAQGVVNMNGILNCEVSDVLPPGSYISSCKDVRLQGTTLVASCNNGKDRWVPAELREAHKCSGDITNHEGKLQCVPIKRMEKR
ncbi:MAG TPA: CVNH domain-containing protein [Verrucomicrobiae bacterium]|nr:CVNH domain-containing protein [Verrucomicrobiae bacterium]